MPQLEVETFPSLIFWLALSFAGLYLGLHYYVVPKISTILDLRSKKVEEYLQQAEKFQVEALDLQKLKEQKLHEAHVEAQNLFSQCHREVTDLFREKESLLVEEFRKRNLEFEQTLALKQEKLSLELSKKLPEFVRVFLEKVMTREISEKEFEEIRQRIEKHKTS